VAAGDLIQRLGLPEEVSTQEAAAILGCCKHTVLQILEDGLLEWRNDAPPSSSRPVYRLTLRSVLQVRLAYQTGSPKPPRAEGKVRSRPKVVETGYQVQHLRRKGARPSEDRGPSAS
jgi:hypothetical protein